MDLHGLTHIIFDISCGISLQSSLKSIDMNNEKFNEFLGQCPIDTVDRFTTDRARHLPEEIHLIYLISSNNGVRS